MYQARALRDAGLADREPVGAENTPDLACIMQRILTDVA
jgi:hypothetical protein